MIVAGQRNSVLKKRISKCAAGCLNERLMKLLEVLLKVLKSAVGRSDECWVFKDFHVSPSGTTF